MQILGYILSAFGDNFVEWFFLEKSLHRKNISTSIMVLLTLISGLLITFQSEYAYNIYLNTVVSILLTFLFTFCYRESWIYRLFISLSIYVLAVIAEATILLIVRIFIPVDMMHANETSLFTFATLAALIFEIFYIKLALFIINFFKKHRPKLTIFILFLIIVLVFGIIDLIVTFADTPYIIPTLILSVLLIAAIAGCLYLFNDQLRIQRERMQLAHLEEMQQDQVQHYTALYEANRQVAVQRHDLKNILLNVRSYIEVGEIEKLDKYVANFQEKLQPSTMIDNGMPFIDAVLSAKMTEHPEIPFEHNISLLALEHITQPQIAFILATALDNAIEACSQSEKPFIKVRLGQQGHMISLVVVNAADKPVKAIGDNLLTTKTDSASHGYGVKSMKQAAEQAHGMLTWSYEQQTFTLSVLLQDIAD